MAPCPHHRHGGVVHPATHGVLRGQRTAFAAVAVAAAPSLLAPAQYCRLANSGLGAETPSTPAPFSHYLQWHRPMTMLALSFLLRRHLWLMSGAAGSRPRMPSWI